MKIAICSSMSKPEFAANVLEIAQHLEKSGHQVKVPFETQDILHEKMVNNRENTETDRERRLKFIDIIKDFDAILVTNREKNNISWYIGGASLVEMAIAFSNHKPIFILNPLPEVSEIKYVQEIKLMRPIILNGDLTKIQ